MMCVDHPVVASIAMMTVVAVADMVEAVMMIPTVIAAPLLVTMIAIAETVIMGGVNPVAEMSMLLALSIVMPPLAVMTVIVAVEMTDAAEGPTKIETAVVLAMVLLMPNRRRYEMGESRMEVEFTTIALTIGTPVGRLRSLILIQVRTAPTGNAHEPVQPL